MKLTTLALFAGLLWTGACQGQPSPLPTFPAATSEGATALGTDLSESLATLIEGRGIPSLSVAVYSRGKLIASGATGVRKMGSPERVERDDKYHIGSCTKSMTATLAAMLVESGDITWDLTIGEAFEELDVNPGFQDVRLDQLLTNRGGVAGDVEPGLWSRLWASEDTPSNMRMQLVKATVSEVPAYAPGTKFEYSNAGFSIAGAMLERATGIPYEQLLTERLFEPLGMDSAGFRAPATPGLVDQPYGHTGTELTPVEPEPGGDNPTAIAPAGAVHCSSIDLAKYVSFHLGLGPELITAESRARLHLPVGDDNYAMGWMALERPWADGLALNHNGSNTMFYAVMWASPAKEFAAVAMCNSAGFPAQFICDQAVTLAVQTYLE